MEHLFGVDSTTSAISRADVVTTAEWLAANLAAAPPLTAAQVSALRPVFAPAIPHMHAALTEARAAPASTAPQDPTERTVQ